MNNPKRTQVTLFEFRVEPDLLGFSLSQDADGVSVLALDLGILARNETGEWTATLELLEAAGGSAFASRLVSLTVAPSVLAPMQPDFTVVRDVDTLEEIVSFFGRVGADGALSGVDGSAFSATLATGVSDPNDDAVSVYLSAAASTPANLFETAPAVSLSGGADEDKTIVLSGGAVAAGVLSAPATVGVWTAAVLLRDAPTDEASVTAPVTVATVTVTASEFLVDYTLSSDPLLSTAEVREAVNDNLDIITVATGLLALAGELNDFSATLELVSSTRDEEALFDGNATPTVSLVSRRDARSVTVYGGRVRGGASGSWTARVLIVANEEVASSVVESDYEQFLGLATVRVCLLYTSPSPRDATLSRMPSSA